MVQYNPSEDEVSSDESITATKRLYAKKASQALGDSPGQQLESILVKFLMADITAAWKMEPTCCIYWRVPHFQVLPQSILEKGCKGM